MRMAVSFLQAVTALALVVAHAGAADAVDDDKCSFKLFKFRCEPLALCSYQYKFGDVTPNQSCRVRPGVNKLPQQIHLAYAGQPTGTGMTMSWSTFEEVDDSAVWIGESMDSLLLQADVQVSSGSYYEEGSYSLFQHHATVHGLVPNTKYYYKVGSASNASLESDLSTFTTARNATDNEVFNVGIYGDLGFGRYGEATTEYINTLGEAISFIYHIGDIGYADDDFLDPSQALGFFYEEVYNKWMNSMAPIMNLVPYMVSVGNHEAECHSPACLVSNFKKDHLGNYSAYNSRFHMPCSESKGVKNMWYSFEYGPIHFTTISSETDYPDAPSNSYTGTHKNGGFGDQLTWLEADLKLAQENRGNVPWLIVGMHRPMYHLKDVNAAGQPTGDSKALQAAFEGLFIKYGVDVVIAGHEHSYERHLPIARGVAVTDGVTADRQLYANPKAPVYFVTGGAGNPEPNSLSTPANPAKWNAVGLEEYGISTMTVARDTLVFKYLDASNQQVLDQFTIFKG